MHHDSMTYEDILHEMFIYIDDLPSLAMHLAPSYWLKGDTKMARRLYDIGQTDLVQDIRTYWLRVDTKMARRLYDIGQTDVVQICIRTIAGEFRLTLTLHSCTMLYS